jgi:Protein of unknown function (DUF3306)
VTDRPAPPKVTQAGFLSRWSQRKREQTSELRQEPGIAAPVAHADQQRPPTPLTPAAAPEPIHEMAPEMAPNRAPSMAPKPNAPAKLTLADVEQLTAQSDFSAFTAKSVDADVRNAAMKKLFHGEPQFNVMDGLDVYIDDYNTPDPLPKAIMRTMLQARALGLLDDELKDQDKPEPDAPAHGAAPADTPAPHEDADLQLQPHDAAGHACTDPGPDGGPAHALDRGPDINHSGDPSAA